MRVKVSTSWVMMIWYGSAEMSKSRDFLLEIPIPPLTD